MAIHSLAIGNPFPPRGTPPLKILHVTQGYSPAIGGTEWLVQRVSEELVETFRDDVTVFTTNCLNGEAFSNPRSPRLPLGWDEINGVRVRRFPVQSRISQLIRLPQALAYRLRLPFNEYLRAVSGGPVIAGFTKAIREFPADVIVASSFPLLHMFAALRAARDSGRPCVLHGGLHPEDGWGFDRAMIYRAIRQATYYIANTEFEAQHVISRGVSPDRVFVVGVGVDLKPFERVCAAEAKRRLGLEGRPVVGFIGQLGGHKGVDTLVRAMPAVWKAVPETALLIAGARTLFATHLEKMINQWPESDRKRLVLHYNFEHEEKPLLFAAVDVFAYPSGFESFGIAFLEAWAAGKPVIGCRRGAVPWVVHAGRDGLLIDYQDEEMLAEAIITMLENPRWAEALGEAGRKKTLARYTFPEIGRRFREIYLRAVRDEA